MTGTGLAQVIPVAISPILTRLYTPEDFGVFAFYVSLCAILAVIVTGKYELAVVVPKRSSESINLVALIILLSIFISLILLSLVFLWGKDLAMLLEHPEIQSWLYLAPLSTMILGCYHALNFWANRRSRYKSMAVSRVVQSSAAGVSQLVAGIAKTGAAGLILGQLTGQFVSAIYLAISFPKRERSLLRCISLKRMIWVARKHNMYPKYMLPGQCMSVGATELPLLVITVFFGVGIAGFYSLAQRIMAAPLSLVANAVGDVYRQQAAEQFAKHGECRDIFVTTLRRLVFFALFPVLPVLLFGPSLFAIVFGENWRIAGEIASILSVLTFFQIVSSPLSGTVLLSNGMRMEFFWQTARLILVAVIFYISSIKGLSYQYAIVAYVFVFSIMYLLHSFWQYSAAQGLEHPK